ncbi:MAG TPA: hypothetical protein VMZ27_14290 [Candidatus Saccharimonadales bacterium]|nr:hypothetical protein [Candidatus Saccharimonadales bacterium]
MRSLRAIFIFIVLLPVFQAIGSEMLTVRSRTGQFVMQGMPQTYVSGQAGTSNLMSYVRLDPRLFAISCEHIKAAVLNELGLSDQWRGTITVVLHPNERDEENIQVASIRYKSAWAYQLNIPERVERGKLVKVIIQVVLMEIANRRAGEREAELPRWLGEGLTANLMAGPLADLALESETVVVRKEHKPEPLKTVREMLHTRPALGFNELTLPEGELLSEAQSDYYAVCAQLFLHELLRLKDGHQCLRQMIYILPEHLNWQTAFLRGFREHFSSLLEADKWWSLVAANFQNKETSVSWNEPEVWRQLQNILSTSADVRLKKEDLPMKIQAPLQTVLSEWDYSKQATVLQMKVNHLQALRLRVPDELGTVVNGYANVLSWYLSKRGVPKGDFNKLNRKARSAVAEALKRINALDARVDFLRNQTNAPVQASLKS